MLTGMVNIAVFAAFSFCVAAVLCSTPEFKWVCQSCRCRFAAKVATIMAKTATIMVRAARLAARFAANLPPTAPEARAARRDGKLARWRICGCQGADAKRYQNLSSDQ